MATAGPKAVAVAAPAGLQAALQRAMPFALSAFLHAGALLVLLFVGLVVYNAPKPPGQDGIDPNNVPRMAFPVGQLARPLTPREDLQPGGGSFGNSPKVEKQPKFERPQELVQPKGIERPPLKIIGAAGERAGRPEWGDSFWGPMSPGHGKGRGNGIGDGEGDGVGPGNGGPGVDDVVFVIDRSGSMIDSFPRLATELRRIISSLDQTQRFHVIMFAAGKPLECTPGRVVPADKAYKLQFAAFLDTIVPEGKTDPVPALKRAFEVLKGSPERSKIICLLTDGAFPDDAPVLELINRANADRKIAIRTFLYGPPNEAAQKTLRRVAAENGGQDGYRYVRPD